MRDLAQCRAEIFRLSQEKTKKRRQRRRQILTCCIPLVICLAAAFLLLPAQQNKTAAGTDGAAETAGSITCSYVQAEIRSTDECRSVTDKVAVTKIFSALHSMYAQEPTYGMGGETSVPEKGQENLQGASGSNQGEYTVTLATAHGEETVYALSGNFLTNRSTGQVAELTEIQLSQLKAALGLED